MREGTLKRGCVVRLLLVGGLVAALIAGAALLRSLVPRAARRCQTGAAVTRSTSRSATGPGNPARAESLLERHVLAPRPDRSAQSPRPRARVQAASRSRSPAPRAARTEFTGNGQTNTRVTQDCSLRAQAGERIAINPLDQNNMLVAPERRRVPVSTTAATTGRSTARRTGATRLRPSSSSRCWTGTRPRLVGIRRSPGTRRVTRTSRAFSSGRSPGERDRRREVERRHPRGVLPLARRTEWVPGVQRALPLGVVATRTTRTSTRQGRSSSPTRARPARSATTST